MLREGSPTDPFVQSQLAYSLLMADHEEALKKIQHLEESQQILDLKIVSLEAEISRLKEQLHLMQHRHFGKKSETQIGEPINGQAPLQTVSGYTRKKGKKSRGRNIDTGLLPRH